MIVDASIVIDAVGDPGPRGAAAREALASAAPSQALLAPGLLPIEVMSGLHGASRRPAFPLRPDSVPQALRDAADFGIQIEPTPWQDVRRAWALAQGSLRYTDALYVAAAERHRTALITSDARIERSGAPMTCQVITVQAVTGEQATGS